MKKFAILTVWCFIASCLFAQNERNTTLSADLIQKSDSPFSLVEGWRYRSGDSELWADPNYEDEDWERADTKTLSEEPSGDGWKGIGWFRLNVTVDSSLWNQPLALIYSQCGAAEI